MIIRRPSCGAFSTGWSQRTCSNYKVARTRSDRHENWKQKVDRESASGAIDRQCGSLESLARSAQYGLHTIAIQMRMKRQILAMH